MHAVFLNPNDRPVAYKLWTNTPTGLFIVDPNMGLVWPKKTLVVDILMEPYVPYVEGEPCMLYIEAKMINDHNIDPETYWNNTENNNNIWKYEFRLVIIEDVRDYLNDFENILEVAEQFPGLIHRVEMMIVRERRKRLNRNILILAMVVIVWVLSMFW
ncbi:uncharacterized protein [Drosophila kikkawai]|uniref:MSP domain-containing protein n=1 Tax=Drosophila kikkawai TaxID=30033 RepID=A0ABM3C5E0_DROKI|nr:uncharacterized protein LOC121502169 [Drosophila kikkawai]